MRKFKPLDLSFMAAAGSPERESFRNVAAMINSNAGWSEPTQASVREFSELQAKQKKEYDAKHKPTFLSGLFDLLSFPLYGLGNALDESIAGHQSDNNDSVLSDIGKTVGGVFTGAVKGMGAGLRGATSMLDVLPGVDISDEWQQDPTDKTRFSDVNTRLTAKMSTADAMKPENWEKVRENVKKEKAELDSMPGIRDLLYPDMDAEDAREKYFQHMGILGIAEDIVADPLNFVGTGWAKNAARAPATISEGLDAARAANSSSGINAGLKVAEGANLKGVSKFEKPAIPSEPMPVIKPDMVPPTLSPASAIPNALNEGGGALMPALKTGFKNPPRAAATPKKGYEISPRDQGVLVSDIAKLAGTNQPGWIYKAADLLQKHPTVDFADTARFLDMADKMAKAKGIRHDPARLAAALKSRVASDVARARNVEPAERILNTADATNIIVQAAKPKLRPQQAAIANNVVAKFTKQVLGKEAAPGTGQGLASNISAGVNSRWSGPQQARMWNQITSSIKFNGPKKYDVAAKILAHVEDYFISKGAIPYSSAKIGESVEGLRLSQVAMAIGPKLMAENPNLVTQILRGDKKAMQSLPPEAAQRIEQLKASEAMASAPATAQGIAAGKAFAKDITSKVQSAGRAQDELRNAGKVGEIATARLGGGPVAAKVANDYLNRLVRNPGGIDGMFAAKQLDTTAWLARSARHGTKFNPVDKAFAKHVTNAISKASQLPPPAQLGRIAGPAARVSDWLGARFNAAYGVKDMRPVFLRNQASALSTAARRAKYINQLAKTFPPKDINLWHEAFRAAQADSITAGRVSELQAEIAKTMENLFGGTGLRAGAIADATVVARSRLFLDEINTNLRRFGMGEYQFTNGKKVKDAVGVERDFSKGADWLKSWETWNVTKPYEFLHRVQQAIEHTVREKMMFDEIAARFGSPNKHKGVSYAIDHPRLKGYYFTAEGAKQGKEFLRILKEVNTPSPKGLQHLDHVLSKIKASLTIYIPSHHWTNVIGDTMFNWMAGVNDPRRYTQAMKVMSAQRGRYEDIFQFQKGIAGPDALKEAIARGTIGAEGMAAAGLKANAAGNSVIITMRNGEKVTADMIYTAAMREGILPSARVLEEITSDVTSVLDKFRPFGGNVQRGVHKVSEVRDHIPRLAQFVDGLAKSSGSFAGAIEKSAANVRKWHPDGLDLTKFERGVLKRVFPFYSWTRKAIPLAIESSLVASSKVMAYPRLMELIATANGVDGENDSSGGAFPGDQMFPDWLRERGIGPVAGGPGSYLFVNPSTPVLDIMTMLGHPGQGALDMLNPMAKVPLELAQGATLGKTVPIENEADYLSKQIPGLSQAGRVTGYFGTSKSVADSEEQKMLNLLNLLTGAKATQSGIYQKSAQFDLRDYISKKAKEARE